jgi:hypothetical protein
VSAHGQRAAVGPKALCGILESDDSFGVLRSGTRQAQPDRSAASSGMGSAATRSIAWAPTLLGLPATQRHCR